MQRSARRRPAIALTASALGAIALMMGSAQGHAKASHADASSRPVLAGPTDIVTGPDGNLWFTERWANRIGRITPAGRITEFSQGISRHSGPEGITAGPDGNLWFTEFDGGRIGRVTPQGRITEFSRGMGRDSGPAGITAGPDGNLWFTERWANRIGRITPGGRVTVFALKGDGRPDQITAGPDGALWFTEYLHSYVGRITTAGMIRRVWTGGVTDWPNDIVAGADGNLWVTSADWTIWRMRPDGTTRAFPIEHGLGVPAGGSVAGSYIAAGPDGNLWFTYADWIGQITPSGAVSVRSRRMVPGWRGQGMAGASRITTGPDGNLWFTEPGGRRIGRLTPGGSMREFPASAVILSTRLQDGGSATVRLRCPSGDSAGCRGVLSVELGPWIWDDGNYKGHPTPIGSRRIDLAPGRTQTVRVPLRARGRELLRRAPANELGVARLRPVAPGTAGQMVIFFDLRKGEQDAAARVPRLASATNQKVTRKNAITGATTITARFSGIPQRRNRVGAAHAPVTITVFGDIASSATKRLSERTLAPLLRRYVRTGRVKMILRPVALISISSERGALASDAAAQQNSLWPMASLLLRNQGAEGRDWLSDRKVEEAAAKLGLDADRLAHDYQGLPVALVFMRDDVAFRSLGLRSVPSSLVRGPRGRRVIVGAPGPHSFAAAISAVT